MTVPMLTIIIEANLSRSDISASGHLSLTHNISCYHRVFAFDIDVNKTISNLAIEWTIMRDSVHVYGKIDIIILCYACSVHNHLNNFICSTLRSGKASYSNILITTTLITILLILTVLAVIITFAIRQHNKKSKTY